MQWEVLVLNANFEPIHVCDIRRAIGLIYTMKATMIMDGRGTIRTPSNAFPIPSVIRLQRMVQRPRPTVRLTRREVFRRDDFTCQYCGKSNENLTIDHIIPKHLGGKETWTNVITACSHCNHLKGGKKLQDTNLSLRKTPKAPPQSAKYFFEHYLRKNVEWEPFILGW